MKPNKHAEKAKAKRRKIKLTGTKAKKLETLKKAFGSKLLKKSSNEYEALRKTGTSVIFKNKDEYQAYRDYATWLGYDVED
jgi:hypothetical protein